MCSKAYQSQTKATESYGYRKKEKLFICRHAPDEGRFLWKQISNCKSTFLPAATTTTDCYMNMKKKKNSSTTGFYLIPTSLSSRGPKYSVCATICDMNQTILYFGKVVEKKKQNLKINKSERSKRACACV